MDPISVASSIAGLVHLASEVCEKINDYIRAVRNYPKDVAELRDELELLSGVLSQLQNFLESPQAKTSKFNEDSVLRKALSECKKRLERIGDKIKPPQGNKMARAWERFKWPFDQKEVTQMMENLRRYTHVFNFAVSIKGCSIMAKVSQDAQNGLVDMLADFKKQSESLKQIGIDSIELQNKLVEIQTTIEMLPKLLEQSQSIREMNQSMRMAEDREQRRMRAEILEWLAPLESLHKHVKESKQRIPGSGQWFLEHENFVQWATDPKDRRDLLCVGGPGRGKTVLCSSVIDHLRLKHKDQEVAVAFYYCDYQEQHAQTAFHLAGSILRQLCQFCKTVPAAVTEFYQQHRDGIKDVIYFQNLQSVLKKVIAAFDQCFFVIDALDETDADDQRPELFEVLNIMRESSGNTKIFATTRPQPIIEELFHIPIKIEVSAQEDDLRHFLSRKIDEHPNSKYTIDATLKEDIISKLCSHADGMFFLPAFQIKEILHQRSKGDIKRTLKNLPTSFSDLFRSTMDRIKSSSNKDLAYKILMWISHARRHLTIQELQHAVALRFDEEDFDKDDMVSVELILESCCGLIELVEGSSLVRFVHFSLYEQLRKEDHGLFTGGELNITRSCLKYLSFDSFRPLTYKNRTAIFEALSEYPFLDYAAFYWGYHARGIEVQSYQDLALSLLNDGKSLLVIAKIRDIKSPDSRKWVGKMWPWSLEGGGVSLAASFGLADLIRVLISSQSTPQVMAKNMYGSTPLHECAMHGYEEAAEVLVAHGAELLHTNLGKATPFYLAVSYGQLRMCETLIKYNRQQLDVHCKDGFTALHKASDIGSEVMVTFLLQQAALVNVVNDKGMTPLHLACEKGYLGVVRLLVLAGANITIKSDPGWSALDYAASGGHFDVAKYLLDQGVSVSDRCQFNRTPLHRAAQGGYTTLCQLLLQQGADVLATDDEKSTPLIRAVKWRHMDTVKYLLQHDQLLALPQLQQKSFKKLTAKEIAYDCSYYDMHKYLRDFQDRLLGYIDNLRPDLDPTMPVTLAIESGDLNAVQQMIESDPRLLTYPDALGQTPLHTAFLENQWDIAVFLLERGVPIDTKGYHSLTPLHIACSQGSVRMMSLALDYGADVHAVSTSLQTPLHKAASSHSVEVITELLRCGAEPSTPNNKGMTAVHVGAYRNFIDGVREMLKPEYSTKPIVLLCDRKGRTAKFWANMGRHLEMVAFLRVEEKRAKGNLTNRTSPGLSRASTGRNSLDGQPLSRQDTMDSTRSRRSTGNMSSSMTGSTLSLPSIPYGSHHHIRRLSTDSLFSQDTNSSERAQTPSPLRTPTTPLPSTPNPMDDPTLVEIEMRYAAMELEFESD